MRELGNLVVVAAVVVIGSLLHYAFSKRRIDRFRQSFLADRQPLSDDEFLAQLQLDNDRDRRLAVLIRRVVAEQISFPAQMLQATDSLADLLYRMKYFHPNELAAARDAIEAEFAVTFDYKQQFQHTMDGVGPYAGETLGDYVRYHVENFDALTAPAPIT